MGECTVHRSMLASPNAPYFVTVVTYDRKLFIKWNQKFENGSGLPTNPTQLIFGVIQTDP